MHLFSLKSMLRAIIPRGVRLMVYPRIHVNQLFGEFSKVETGIFRSTALPSLTARHGRRDWVLIIMDVLLTNLNCMKLVSKEC
jgi:hypothetical protein